MIIVGAQFNRQLDLLSLAGEHTYIGGQKDIVAISIKSIDT